MSEGVLAAILGGWQVGGTFEYQPGALLTWGNVFFYGDFDDIAVDDPTLDRWFNVDAGFERDPPRSPRTSRSACSRSGSTGCADRTSYG